MTPVQSSEKKVSMARLKHLHAGIDSTFEGKQSTGNMWTQMKQIMGSLSLKIFQLPIQTNLAFAEFIFNSDILQ